MRAVNTRGKRPSLVGLGEWDEAVDRFKTAIQLFEALEARRLSPLAASPRPRTTRRLSLATRPSGTASASGWTGTRRNERLTSSEGGWSWQRGARATNTTRGMAIPSKPGTVCVPISSPSALTRRHERPPPDEWLDSSGTVRQGGAAYFDKKAKVAER